MSVPVAMIATALVLDEDDHGDDGFVIDHDFGEGRCVESPKPYTLTPQPETLHPKF